MTAMTNFQQQAGYANTDNTGSLKAIIPTSFPNDLLKNTYFTMVH